MALQRYFPSVEAEQVLWLNNYTNKLPTHGPTVGITAPEISDTLQDIAHAKSILDNWYPTIQQDAQEATAYKRLILDSPANTIGGGAVPRRDGVREPADGAPAGRAETALSSNRAHQGPPQLHDRDGRRLADHRPGRQRRASDAGVQSHRRRRRGAASRADQVHEVRPRRRVDRRPAQTAARGARWGSTWIRPTSTTARCWSQHSRDARIPPALLGRRRGEWGLDAGGEGDGGGVGGDMDLLLFANPCHLPTQFTTITLPFVPATAAGAPPAPALPPKALIVMVPGSTLVVTTTTHPPPPPPPPAPPPLRLPAPPLA